LFEELEYKYRADNVSLSDFKALMATLEIKSRKEAASWDIYYVQENDFESFQRFRLDKDSPELTKKVKTKDANNWKRVESDLPLDPKKITEESVAFHVGLDGYKENFRIYKYCDIYFENQVNYVYYVVYDLNMKETGRFIEVEVNKDRVRELNLLNSTGAIQFLNYAEKLLEKLGISPQNRLKKSLFEIYRKET
jgi:hypothetical protein